MGDRYTSTIDPGAESAEKFSPRDMDLSARYYLPDDAAKNRVGGYVEAEQLLDVSEHLNLFSIRIKDTEASYIPLDFAGMLSRLMRHYIFSPGFEVRALDSNDVTADANVKRITKNSDAVTLFREVAESLPALGDAVIRVDLVDPETIGMESGEKKQAKMRYVFPHQAHVKRHLLDNQKVEEVTLAWLFPPETFNYPDGEDRSILLREIHKPGTREFLCDWWDKEKNLTPDGQLFENFPGIAPGVESTGINEIPIAFIANNRKAGSFWGRSEFPRIKPIIQALENRLAQLDEVLEKHARPKLVVGPGTLDDRGQTLMDHFDVIEVESSVLEKAVQPSYLTWDMKIEGIKHEMEKLEEYFFIFTETSPASFGLERDGSQVESARALRFKAHRTINKVQDMRDPFGDAVRRLFRIAQKLESGPGGHGYDVAEVKLEWPDPIIEDDSQEAQDYSMLRQNQLVSVRRAVQDLHDLTDAEAEVEVARILEDEVNFAEAASAGLVPSGSATGEESALPTGGESSPPAGLGEVVAAGASV